MFRLPRSLQGCTKHHEGLQHNLQPLWGSDCCSVIPSSGTYHNSPLPWTPDQIPQSDPFRQAYTWLLCRPDRYCLQCLCCLMWSFLGCINFFFSLQFYLCYLLWCFRFHFVRNYSLYGTILFIQFMSKLTNSLIMHWIWRRYYLWCMKHSARNYCASQ